MPDELKGCFEASYFAEFVDTLPAHGAVVEMRWPDDRRTGAEMTYVCFYRRQGDTWLGGVARSPFRTGVTALYTTPDPDRACVLTLGRGYLINADSPGAFEPLPIEPVVAVLSVSDPDALVFASFTEVATYKRPQRVWVSKRLAYDGIRLLGAHGPVVSGEAWSAPKASWVPFQVNVSLDACAGGAYD